MILSLKLTTCRKDETYREAIFKGIEFAAVVSLGKEDSAARRLRLIMQDVAYTGVSHNAPDPIPCVPAAQSVPGRRSGRVTVNSV